MECNDRLTPGDIVIVKPRSDANSPSRLDIVVVESDDGNNNEFPCVKRIWGLPGERIELKQGDAWLNGRRYQKSIGEFFNICVPISRFPDDIGSHWYFHSNDSIPTSGNSTGIAVESIDSPSLHLLPNQHIEFRYQHLQRTDGKVKLAESSINDDCAFNQNSVHAIHSVEDYLVKVEFSNAGSAPKLWRIHSDNAQKAFSLCCIEQPENGRSSTIFAKRWLMVGVCDGRLLAASDVEDHHWDLEVLKVNDATAPARTFIANQSNSQLTIVRLFVARDLWLGPRQPRLDAWVPESDATDGYFLLGDNLSISNDSRNADFGRIERGRISGIVVR
jgi:signal peptidase I